MEDTQTRVSTPLGIVVVGMLISFGMAGGIWVFLGPFGGALWSAGAFTLGVMVEAGRRGARGSLEHLKAPGK